MMIIMPNEWQGADAEIAERAFPAHGLNDVEVEADRWRDQRRLHEDNENDAHQTGS